MSPVYPGRFALHSARATLGLFLLGANLARAATPGPARHTSVSIVGEHWHLNGQPTYRGTKAEGLLMNVRMVNATFEDRNRPEYDADGNTAEFLARIADYEASGVKAFTLNLQGGLPAYEGAVNSAFNPDGSLRPEYLARVQRVIEACDRAGVVVILGCYYQRQDQLLRDDAAVRTGVVNVVQWLKEKGVTNVVLEIANEYAHRGYDRPVLKTHEGMGELVALAKATWPALLVSTSEVSSRGTLPRGFWDHVAPKCDFILIHFNHTPPADLPARLAALPRLGKPIVCNEDTKVADEGAAAASACVTARVSWGLMHEAVNQRFPFTFVGTADDRVVYRRIRELTSLEPEPRIERRQREAEAYFPPAESRGGWRKLEAPEDIARAAGMKPERLDELKAWLLASDKRNFAATVVRRGHIVLEVERGNSAKTDSRRVASVSKAVCATVLAIASELSKRGDLPRKMSFDDRAFDFIPQAQPLSDPRKAQITVRQLFNHTSGICPESTGAPNDGRWEYYMGHTGDERTAKLAFDPGTGSGYSTHALHHASLVCETVSGVPYDQFAIQHLFEPLGIEKSWFQFADGDERHGRHPTHGLGMPARELARIAYCMLRGGKWGGQQVIPRWFVDESGVPTHGLWGVKELRTGRDANHYSHAWERPTWVAEVARPGEPERPGMELREIPTDARFKRGSGGQFIAFVPSLDLVITRQTGGSGAWDYEEYLRRACRAVMSAEEEEHVAQLAAAADFGTVEIGRGGADGFLATSATGTLHVVYGGRYRTGTSAESLSPEEPVTNIGKMHGVRIAVDQRDQPHVVFTTGATNNAKQSYYTARVNGRWLPAEKFADAADFPDRGRAYVADVAVDENGVGLVSFWVSRPTEKRAAFDDPSFYYRWRSATGEWSAPRSLPAHWSSAPKVEYAAGRGFYLMWQHRGTDWRISGPVAGGAEFTVEGSFSTGSPGLTAGMTTVQNEGADFSVARDGGFIVAGNVREKFEGPVGVWAAFGREGAIAAPVYLGSFAGTVRGNESGLHPVTAFDAATGDAFVAMLDPKSKTARFAVHRRDRGWERAYHPLLPDRPIPQGTLRQGPSIADVPGPGVLALVRDGEERWFLKRLSAP